MEKNNMKINNNSEWPSIKALSKKYGVTEYIVMRNIIVGKVDTQVVGAGQRILANAEQFAKAIAPLQPIEEK